MQFRVNQAINAKYEIHRANNPLIRQVVVPNKLSFHPEEFMDSTQWIVSTPATTGEFTAVGYFFARDIYEQLHVPIGLIYDNWGGSQVESWISREAMLGSDALGNYARQMSDNWDTTNTRVEKIFRDTLHNKKWRKNFQSEFGTICELQAIRFPDGCLLQHPVAGTGSAFRDIAVKGIWKEKSGWIPSRQHSPL